MHGLWQEPEIRHRYGGVSRTLIFGEVILSEGLVMIGSWTLFQIVGEKLGITIFNNGETFPFPPPLSTDLDEESFMSLCARLERIFWSQEKSIGSDDDLIEGGDSIFDPLRREHAETIQSITPQE